MAVPCNQSHQTPLQDFQAVLHANPGVYVAWYIGKASKDLVNGTCNPNARQIRSFQEHLPIGHGHALRGSHHKILSHPPNGQMFSFFYPGHSERLWFKRIFKDIPACHPNLNIRIADGGANVNCYLHLYVGVNNIEIHRD